MRHVQCPLTLKVEQLMVKVFEISDALAVVIALMSALPKHYHILPVSLNFLGIKDGTQILEIYIKYQF